MLVKYSNKEPQLHLINFELTSQMKVSFHIIHNKQNLSFVF